jgi:hypothetical protein
LYFALIILSGFLSIFGLYLLIHEDISKVAVSWGYLRDYFGDPTFGGYDYNGLVLDAIGGCGCVPWYHIGVYY